MLMNCAPVTLVSIVRELTERLNGVGSVFQASGLPTVVPVRPMVVKSTVPSLLVVVRGLAVVLSKRTMLPPLIWAMPVTPETSVTRA